MRPEWSLLAQVAGSLQATKTPERCVGPRRNTKPPLPLNKAAKPLKQLREQLTCTPRGVTISSCPPEQPRGLEKVWGVVLLLLLLEQAGRNEIQQRSRRKRATWRAMHSDKGDIFV